MKKLSFLFIIPFLIAGCSSGKINQPYNSSSMTGYKVIQMSETKYRLTAYGGKRNSMDELAKSSLKQAAAITLKNQYDFFVVYETSSGTITSQVTTIYGNATKSDYVSSNDYSNFSIIFELQNGKIPNIEGVYDPQKPDSLRINFISKTGS